MYERQLTAGLALIRDRYIVAAGIDSAMLRDGDGEQHVVSIGLD